MVSLFFEGQKFYGRKTDKAIGTDRRSSGEMISLTFMNSLMHTTHTELLLRNQYPFTECNPHYLGEVFQSKCIASIGPVYQALCWAPGFERWPAAVR